MREKNKSNNGGNDMIKNIQSLMDKSKNFAKKQWIICSRNITKLYV